MTLRTTTLAGAIAAAFAIAAAAAPIDARAEAEHDHSDTASPVTMGHGMMGHETMGMGMMGMMGGNASPAELDTIHQLVVNHDSITRTVTKLADGIRTLTESDDPRIAELIKDHVAAMIPRMEARRDLDLPIETQALRDIMRNGDKVTTTVETTDKGSIVTQTSTDPAVVAALQEHADGVSDIVSRGMEAIHTAMMNNHGAMAGGHSQMGQSMMGHGMMGQGMMGNGMMGRGMMGGGMMPQPMMRRTHP